MQSHAGPWSSLSSMGAGLAPDTHRSGPLTPGGASFHRRCTKPLPWHPWGPPVLQGETQKDTRSAPVPCPGCLPVLFPTRGQPTVARAPVLVRGGPQ